ncbi:MAG: ATP-binding cassette domain-containing protein [Anaerovoracaceae bacterium]
MLKGFDLEIERGEIFALLGKNGAGKTTALECIEGLKKFDCGQISVKGKMGIQTQNSSLPAHIKALEALRLFASWRGSEPDRTAIERLGISELKRSSTASFLQDKKEDFTWQLLSSAIPTSSS